MLNFSNILSLSRAALALFFLQNNPWLRFMAIILAMVTDFLDGFLARRQGNATQFGAFLDPIMDKFFVFFAGGVLFLEMRLNGWELATLISRDLSLCLFGIYLLTVKGWKGYECKAIFWGKLTTVFQFLFLIGLSLNIKFPPYFYFLFVAMAALAFIELVFNFKRAQE